MKCRSLAPAFLMIALLTSSAYALDPDELRVRCLVPTALIKKAIAAKVVEQAENGGFEQVKVSVKMNPVGKADKDVIFTDDLVIKQKVKKVGNIKNLQFEIANPGSVKPDACSVDFDIIVKVKAKSFDGMTVSNEYKTEFVTVRGSMQ